MPAIPARVELATGHGRAPAAACTLAGAAGRSRRRRGSGAPDRPARRPRAYDLGPACPSARARRRRRPSGRPRARCSPAPRRMPSRAPSPAGRACRCGASTSASSRAPGDPRRARGHARQGGRRSRAPPAWLGDPDRRRPRRPRRRPGSRHAPEERALLEHEASGGREQRCVHAALFGPAAPRLASALEAAGLAGVALHETLAEACNRRPRPRRPRRTILFAPCFPTTPRSRPLPGPPRPPTDLTPCNWGLAPIARAHARHRVLSCDRISSLLVPSENRRLRGLGARARCCGQSGCLRL